MKQLLLIFVGLLIFLSQEPAHAQFVNGQMFVAGPNAPTPTCPLTFSADPDGTTDGCQTLVGLNHVGVSARWPNYTDMVAELQKTGQTWTVGQSSQIEPWNIPDVGRYAIGPYTTYAAAADLYAAAATGGPLCTSGSGATCSPCSQTHQADGTSLEVLCGVGGVAVDIEGYTNFPATGPNAGKCIALRVNGQATQPVTIRNNWFKEGVECATSGNLTAMLNISAGTGTFTLENNDFNGNCAALITAAATGAGTIVDVSDGRRVTGGVTPGAGLGRWNRYHDECNRPMQLTDGPWQNLYWVATNWCQLCSNVGLHGEPFENSTIAIPCTSGICGPLNQQSQQWNKFFVSNAALTKVACCTTSGGYIGAGRNGNEVVDGVVGEAIIGTNPFVNTIQSGTYNNATGDVTLITGQICSNGLAYCTNTYTAVTAGVVTAALTGTNVGGVNGTFPLKSASLSGSCSPSSCQIVYNAGAGLGTVTITGGTIAGANNGAIISETSATLIDTWRVYANYIDVAGGLVSVQGSPNLYACILQGAGTQDAGTAGYSVSGTTYTVGAGAGAAANGVVWPGQVVTQGTGINLSNRPTIQAFGTAGTTGNGLGGTYALDISQPGGSGTSYVTSTAITTVTIPTDAAPHSGGLENWSLTSNIAVTGYQDAKNAITSVCH